MVVEVGGKCMRVGSRTVSRAVWGIVLCLWSKSNRNGKISILRRALTIPLSPRVAAVRAARCWRLPCREASAQGRSCKQRVFLSGPSSMTLHICIIASSVLTLQATSWGELMVPRDVLDGQTNFAFLIFFAFRVFSCLGAQPLYNYAASPRRRPFCHSGG